MKTDNLGVRVLEVIPSKVIPLSVKTHALHIFKYSYSLPEPPRLGWVNFNVTLNVIEVIEGTEERVFDYEYINTEQINNNRAIPPRNLMVDIAESGTRRCYSTFQYTAPSRVNEAPLVTETPSYPLDLSLTEAEVKAGFLFLDFDKEDNK